MFKFFVLVQVGHVAYIYVYLGLVNIYNRELVAIWLVPFNQSLHVIKSLLLLSHLASSNYFFFSLIEVAANGIVEFHSTYPHLHHGLRKNEPR